MTVVLGIRGLNELPTHFIHCFNCYDGSMGLIARKPNESFTRINLKPVFITLANIFGLYSISASCAVGQRQLYVRRIHRRARDLRKCWKFSESAADLQRREYGGQPAVQNVEQSRPADDLRPPGARGNAVAFPERGQSPTADP